MKGIPTSCIQYHSNKNDISVLDIYLQLFNGKPIEFDLTNYNNKCVFRNKKDYSVKSLHKGDKGTTRTCQFKRDENDKIFIN